MNPAEYRARHIPPRRARPRPPTVGQQAPAYVPPPDYPPPPPYDPPSYEDATRSSTAPLLVGPGVHTNYGTQRAYPDLEAASFESTDIEESSRSLPEWVGQALVVFLFLAIIYSFWEFVHADTDLDGWPPA